MDLRLVSWLVPEVPVIGRHDGTKQSPTYARGPVMLLREKPVPSFTYYTQLLFSILFFPLRRRSWKTFFSKVSCRTTQPIASLCCSTISSTVSWRSRKDRKVRRNFIVSGWMLILATKVIPSSQTLLWRRALPPACRKVLRSSYFADFVILFWITFSLTLLGWLIRLTVWLIGTASIFFLWTVYEYININLEITTYRDLPTS